MKCKIYGIRIHFKSTRLKCSYNSWTLAKNHRSRQSPSEIYIYNIYIFLYRPHTAGQSGCMFCGGNVGCAEIIYSLKTNCEINANLIELMCDAHGTK